MTTFVEMSLLWVVRIIIMLAVLFAFFSTNFEFAPAFDPLADVTWEFGTEVPEIVLKHTSQQWRNEHGCVIGYPCQANEAFWQR